MTLKELRAARDALQHEFSHLKDQIDEKNEALNNTIKEREKLAKNIHALEDEIDEYPSNLNSQRKLLEKYAKKNSSAEEYYSSFRK